jgi:hypothetical protein
MFEFNYEDMRKARDRIATAGSNCEQDLWTISEIVYELKQTKIPLPKEISLCNLKLAVESNILQIKSGEILINDVNKIIYFLARSIINKKLFSLYNDTFEFWKEIEKLSYTNQMFNSLPQIILIVLNREYDKNILGSFNKLLKKRNEEWNLWIIIHTLGDSIPYFECNINDLIPFLENIYLYIKGDFAAGIVFNAFENLGKMQPEFSMDLIHKLIKIPNSDAISFIPSIISGISSNNGIEKIYNIAYHLMESKNCQLKNIGITSCSILDYKNAENLFIKTINKYLELEEKQSTENLPTIVRAYGKLIKFDSSLKIRIKNLSYTKIPELQYEITLILSKLVELDCNENWFKLTILNLSSVKSEFKGIVERLDYILYILVERNIKLVYMFLELWIENHSNPHEEEGIPKLFDSTFIKLIEVNKKLFEWYVTKWLNAHDTKFHLHIRKVIHSLSVNKQTLNLNCDYINKMSNKDIKYLIYKILGFILDGKMLVQLTFSVLQRVGDSEKISNYVVSAFDEYIAYNYPGISREFLEEKNKNGTDIEKKVAKRILENMNNYYNTLNNLPKLNEFKPPERRVENYLKSKNVTFNRQVDAQVKKHSVFLDLVQNIEVKGGKTYFSMNDNQYTAKSSMSPIGVEFEFPRGEFINPTGQAKKRYIWQVVKREEI